MSSDSPDSYRIDVRRLDHAGTPWVVRVTRKGALLRRLVTSDWFLDQQQAEEFAAGIRSDLDAGRGIQRLKDRRPGWVLHPSAR